MDPSSLDLDAPDELRRYSEAEDERLARQLQTITAEVHAGTWSARPLDRALLLDLHRRLFDGVRDHAGRHRDKGYGSERLVFGPNRSAHRDEVAARIDALVHAAEREIRELGERAHLDGYDQEAITLAVRLHADLIDVHPFEDGNGRSTRLLMGYTLVRLGLLPIPVEAVKDEYNACLNRYFVQRDLQSLVDLFVRLYPL